MNAFLATKEKPQNLQLGRTCLALCCFSQTITSTNYGG